MAALLEAMGGGQNNMGMLSAMNNPMGTLANTLPQGGGGANITNAMNAANNPMGALMNMAQPQGGNAQPQGPQPTQGGFGDFVKQSGVPLWMGILNAMANPERALGQTIQGYSQYKQNVVADIKMQQIDNFLLSKFSSADWNDPNIKENAQKELIKSGLANSVTSKEILDKYFLKDNKIMYYDVDDLTMYVHQKNDDGTVTPGKMRIPIDSNEMDTNKFYRSVYAGAFPGLRKYIQNQAGSLSPEKATAVQFIKEWGKAGTDEMIKKYGGGDPVVFKSYVKVLTGATPEVEDPTKLVMGYAKELKALQDKHTMRKQAGLDIDSTETSLVQVYKKEIKRLIEKLATQQRAGNQAQGQPQGRPSLEAIMKGGMEIPE